MSSSGFAAQLTADLGPEDVRVVLGVFETDVARLAGELAAAAARGDVSAFRHTCHAVAGAAGVVGADQLEAACRAEMVRTDLDADRLPAEAAKIAALADSARREAEALRVRPQGN